jgi:hypothetical protein
MRASLKLLAVGLLLHVPLATAHAQGPSLSPIANVSLNAGGTLNVNVIAVDALNRPVTVTASVPPFVTLNPPTLATGVVVTSLTLAPSAAQAGDYTGAVTATAGGVSTVRVFQITVNAAGSDRAPVVVAPPLRQVTAGAALSFTVTASDPDGNAITSFTASGVPPGASFAANGSNTSGTFTWTPGAADTGEYDVQFTAANALSGTSVTHIRVASAPALAIDPIDTVTVAGGGFTSVPVHASGVPGALITLTAALPSFGTLNPPGSGTGSVSTTVTLSPPNGSAGTYHASITAISQGASVTQPFDIIVTGSSGGGNHPPVLTAPATDSVAIGATLSFVVSATDADGDHVDLFGSSLPPGSGFVDHANDTGTFTWTPVDGQAGTYVASFSGTDGRGGSGSASTIITVTGGTPVNHPPTVSAPATEQVNGGSHLAFTVTATDPDGDHVALSTGSLPLGATFTDHGDNTGTFSWTPDTSQAGNYGVAFLGNDGRGGTGTANTTIKVVNTSGGGGGGGGGGVVAGRACLIGKFKTQRDSTCFRIRPVHHSFDVNDVILSSIRLRFHGDSLAAMGNPWIEVECEGGHGHGHDSLDGATANRADAGLQGDDDQGDDNDQGEDNGCDVSCKRGRAEGHEDNEDHGHKKRAGDCDTLGIHACFPTEALVLLFSTPSVAGHTSHAHDRLPCALLNADIVATLKNGDTVVATFGGHDEGHGGDDDSQGTGGSDQHSAVSARVMPNPLNPATQVSFTTARDGQVRVAVYDMQGRLVKRLVDEFRAAGAQVLTWDGTSESSGRVPSGVYFLRIQTPEGMGLRRVVVVR